MKSFLQLGISAFHKWVNNAVVVLADNAGQLGITGEEVTQMEAWLGAYNTDYDKCLKENAGKLDRRDRDKTKKILAKGVGDIIAWHVTKNPNATDGIKGILVVNIPDPIRTPQTQIIVAPVMRNRTNAGGLLTMTGKCLSIEGKGLPKGTESMEACWDFIENGITPEAKDCRHSIPFHGAKGTIDVGAERRRSQIAVYGRYLNHFPNPGPWSDEPVRVVVM